MNRTDSPSGDGFQPELVLPAPAKLNLMLRVTGRRDDGYHDLQTVFQMLDYGDQVDVGSRNDGRIVARHSIDGIAPDDDLAVRAARCLQRASGITLGADIRVHKRLPMGAGLGGGSSDAASVMLALNRLWDLDWPLSRLAEVGLALGADVPVFIHGHSAWAEGVGESLEPITLPTRWFVVLCPGVHVSTAQVFGDRRLTRNSPPITIRDFLAGQLDTGVRNDCEAVVRQLFPEVGEALDWLHNASAGLAKTVGMTGTGSSLFAGVDNEPAARALCDSIPRRWRGFVARGVDRSPAHTNGLQI